MQETEVLARLVAWGEAQPLVRAMVLTSSRAGPDGAVDVLSDYDLILAVTDADGFAQDRAWEAGYGDPMVRWGDQGEVFGLVTYFRGIVYQDEAKIDYTIWPDTLLERVAQEPALPDMLDVGYRVLLDKDERTSGWGAPTYRAHIPAKPTTYVAKSLWRDELVIARFVLERDLKLETLRLMLEWRIEIDHDWSVKPGVLGRGLKQLLPADTWSELESTYVGAGSEENWAALFRTTALFRRVAREVGEALGYDYPEKVDEQVTTYLGGVRRLPSAPPLRT
jgi:aminoglycoside 6-adenylyltransferase